jgi:hypothetical protein
MFHLIVDEDRYSNLIAGAATLVRIPIDEQPEDGQSTPDNRYGMWCYFPVYRAFFWVSGGLGSATRTERKVFPPCIPGEVIAISAHTTDERERFLVWDIHMKKRSNMTRQEQRQQGFHLAGPIGPDVSFNDRHIATIDNERQSWGLYEERFGHDAWCFLLEVECIS